MGVWVSSVIRTVVPGIVGGVFGWLAARGLDFPEETRQEATAGAVVATMAGYYALVRAIEVWARRNDSVGVARVARMLLGGPTPKA